jgi:hypothetical protein
MDEHDAHELLRRANVIAAEDLPDPHESAEAQQLLASIVTASPRPRPRKSSKRNHGRAILQHRWALGLVAAVLVAGATVAAVVFPGSSQTSTGLGTFSSRGTPVSFSSDVGIPGLGTPYVLARFGEKVLFRATRPGKSTCYGSGRFDQAGKLTVLLLDCTPFPSPARPVLMDEIGGEVVDRTTRQSSLLFIEGFAADGVAELRLLDGAGHVVSTAQVTNNVFSFEGVAGRGEAGAKLIALDRDGHLVWSRQL